jgi:hypothetical protein
MEIRANDKSLARRRKKKERAIALSVSIVAHLLGLLVGVVAKIVIPPGNIGAIHHQTGMLASDFFPNDFIGFLKGVALHEEETAINGVLKQKVNHFLILLNNHSQRLLSKCTGNLGVSNLSAYKR